MDDQRGITGRTVFTMADHFRAVHWRAYFYRLAGAAALLVLALGLLRIGGLEIGARELGWRDALVVAPVLVLAGLVPFALHARQFSRLGNQQRELTYVVDPDCLVTRDATGALTSMPWSAVRACIEKEWGFLLTMRPAGRRWLLKRAFTPEDLGRLRGLMRAKLGQAAKLHDGG